MSYTYSTQYIVAAVDGQSFAYGLKLQYCKWCLSIVEFESWHRI